MWLPFDMKVGGNGKELGCEVVVVDEDDDGEGEDSESM